MKPNVYSPVLVLFKNLYAYCMHIEVKLMLWLKSNIQFRIVALDFALDYVRSKGELNVPLLDSTMLNGSGSLPSEDVSSSSGSCCCFKHFQYFLQGCLVYVLRINLSVQTLGKRQVKIFFGRHQGHRNEHRPVTGRGSGGARVSSLKKVRKRQAFGSREANI